MVFGIKPKKMKNYVSVANQKFLPKFKEILDSSSGMYKEYLSSAESKSKMVPLQKFVEDKYFKKLGKKIDLRQSHHV